MSMHEYIIIYGMNTQTCRESSREYDHSDAGETDCYCSGLIK